MIDDVAGLTFVLSPLIDNCADLPSYVTAASPLLSSSYPTS